MIKGRTGSYGVADIWSNVVVSPTASACFSRVSTEAMTTRASTTSSSLTLLARSCTLAVVSSLQTA